MKSHVFVMLALVGFAIPAAAQTSDSVFQGQEQASQKQSAERGETFERQVRVVGKMKERVAVEARTTKGAPYSAEAVTESTQTLADGNRINQKATTRIYRDGEGRTRREQLDESGAVESIFIVDPGAGTSYVFEQGPNRIRERMTGTDSTGTVSKDAPATVAFKGNVGGNVFFENRVETRTKAQAEAKMRRAGPETQAAGERGDEGQSVREDLGTTTIEGLAATGTRTTTTIPAGAIGNLQPIKVVSEEWFSPDLKVLLLTKHNDPRSGETIYRLLNVVRAEPDRSLFSVPADETQGKPVIRMPDDSPR
jgi:hypothetical protein